MTAIISYYILTGANNTEKDDTREVYQVSRYSKDWKSQGSCGLFGANTTYPFDAGSARITSYGKYLFVRTCHEMYNGHQANVTFSVDTSKMSIVDSFTGVSNTNLGYVSHSFNQFIQIDNGTLLGCDHGDAYPRAIAVLQYVTNISNGSFVPDYFSTPCKEIDLMTFPGSTGNNYTGASLGAFEYSDSSYLAAGNYDADNNSRNVFISSVSKSGVTPVVRYFSNYSGTSDSASTPHLVKTGSNSFVLLWSSNGYVYYTAIDGTGQQVGSTYKMAGNLSDCVPSIINGKLIWYAWKNSHLPDCPRKSYTHGKGSYSYAESEHQQNSSHQEQKNGRKDYLKIFQQQDREDFRYQHHSVKPGKSYCHSYCSAGQKL